MHSNNTARELARSPIHSAPWSGVCLLCAGIWTVCGFSLRAGEDPRWMPMLGNLVKTEITIIGNTMTNTYLGKTEKGVFVYALDGPPAIKAEFESIMADYPDEGLDADTAEKIQSRFT